MRGTQEVSSYPFEDRYRQTRFSWVNTSGLPVTYPHVPGLDYFRLADNLGLGHSEKFKTVDYSCPGCGSRSQVWP